MLTSRGCRTAIQADIDDPGASASLVDLDRVLDGLLTVLHEGRPDRIEPAARGYIEDAIGAAMAAAVRARDNDLAGNAAGPIGEAAAVARALLAELHDSSARSEALVNRSLELRRQAIRLTARALALRRQPPPVDRATASGAPDDRDTRPRDATDGLHGVRVLVAGDTPGLVEKFTMLLSALGADVRVVTALREAAEHARFFDPDVLLCELPRDAERVEALVDDLRREGLGVPAVAMASEADAAIRVVGRRAGFIDVLAGRVTFSELAEAVRHAIGR
jgi:CheY-like chemotaxis protein